MTITQRQYASATGDIAPATARPTTISGPRTRQSTPEARRVSSGRDGTAASKFPQRASLYRQESDTVQYIYRRLLMPK